MLSFSRHCSVVIFLSASPMFIPLTVFLPRVFLICLLISVTKSIVSLCIVLTICLRTSIRTPSSLAILYSSAVLSVCYFFFVL
ncbi:hypothetical protein C8R46DRAFT_1088011 [Mycena filopes]|nr:hypothetical protein C8R46DRAFT_1088011 [Mycena filopes]